MSKLPLILSKKEICHGKLFRLETVHLRFSNGEERHFERVLGSAKGSVMILPMLNEKTVILVREYAVGVENYIIGFPKGAIDSDEDIFFTANRELQEETGYGAKRMRKAMEFSVSPGYQIASMHLILAQDLYLSPRGGGDEPEPLEVIPWSLDRVDELLEHPEFIEARSIAALLWIERLQRVS